MYYLHGVVIRERLVENAIGGMNKYLRPNHFEYEPKTK